ncbi:DUF4397 domain-containing protein [Mucilaginibacter sp.]|uniref:DUF4397 domain-containing protein n=1 Tax=Mucilaginibacter sp. TaxID=1882438 RepID=UPI0031B6004B
MDNKNYGKQLYSLLYMNIRVKALFIIAFAGMLSACKKNNDAPTVTPTAQVNLVNASNAVINFYQNGTRINYTTSYFPGGTLGYIPFKAGDQNFQIKNAGAATPNYLFSMPLKLDSGKFYSLYVSGQTAESVFLTDDDFSADTGGKAKLRFVNAVPSGGTMVLAFEGRGADNAIITTPQFSNVNYKVTTDFVTVAPGTFNLSVYQSSLALPAQKDTVALAAGRVYTVVGYSTVDNLGKPAIGTTFITNQ